MANHLFGETSMDQAEYHKSKLLRELAWRLFPIDSAAADIRAFARETDIPEVKMKQYLKELIDDRKLLIVSDPYYKNKKKYKLPSRLHVQILTDIKRDPKEFLSQPLINQHEWLGKNWLTAFRAYIQKGEDELLNIPHYIEDNTLLSIIQYMPAYQEWMPFFNQLSLDIITSAFYLYSFQWVMELQQPDVECLRNGYLENEKLPQDVRLQFKAEYAFYQYVLSGKFNEFQKLSLSDQPLYQATQALSLQYQGRNAEALKAYQRALKESGDPFFYNPLYDVFYILALYNDNTATSKKKLVALIKKKELTRSLLSLPVKLLLWHLLGERTDIIVQEIVTYGNNLYALPRLLSWLIIRHFHLDDKVEISDLAVRGMIDREDLKLLQLECSQDFMPFITRADELREQTGLSPLLPPYKKVERWEQIISTLLEKTAPEETIGKAVVKEKAQSLSRIIYYINDFGQITPRLQKSKDGVTWSKGRNIALSTFQIGIPEMNDRDKLLSTHVKHYASSGWGYNETWELQGAKALAELAGYPLVFSEYQPETPVVITKEKPQITVTKTSKGFRIENNVGDTKINSNFILRKETDFLFHVVELSSSQRDLLNILMEIKDFPKESEKQLAVLLPQLSRVLTVHSDLVQNEKQIKKVEADTLITVQLQPMGEGIKAELFVKPFVTHPPYCKAGKGNASVMGTMGEERVQAVRNFNKENKQLQKVLEWLQPISEEQDAEEDVFYFDTAYQCLDMLEILHQHLDTIRIEWPQGTKMTIKGRADFKDLSLSVKGAGQWFEIDGQLKIDTETIIKVSDLIQKVRESKGRFISLSANEFIALSESLRKQIQAMDSFFTEEKGKLKLSSLTANSLLELEEQGAQLKKNPAFSKLIERMEAAEKENFSIPKQLKAELRNYQIDGFHWMSRLAYWGAGACLADDMGLGKTLQAIAVMLSRGKQGASLVVAPASVVLNWKNELERFAPSLTPLVMNDTGCDRKALVENASEYDVVITTYGLLINEAETLAAKEWNVIALDEAHTIKNKETKMSKAAMELNGAFRLLLTGTPLQNHLGEIWNLFQFANPGLLGSFQQFTEKFISPIEKNGDKNRQKQLKRLLQPFILRRTKTEVLDELPEKTEITLHVELDEQERALYENLRREAISNLEEGSATAIQTLAEITKLRQAACHPSLVYPELNLSSAKSSAFMKLVEELMKNNHRSLVFSQFTSHLRLIREELDKAHIDYLYLDGSTSLPERNKLVKEFQTGTQPLFLISLKAGGLGLNLTAADFVIHLDPWWNPSIEDQASDRAYRIGQTRPVTVYRLIATQTIEEKIIRLHQTKKSLADSLLDGSDLAHKLTKEEMLELLKEKDF